MMWRRRKRERKTGTERKREPKGTEIESGNRNSLHLLAGHAQVMDHSRKLRRVRQMMGNLKKNGISTFYKASVLLTCTYIHVIFSWPWISTGIINRYQIHPNGPLSLPQRAADDTSCRRTGERCRRHRLQTIQPSPVSLIEANRKPIGAIKQ